MKSWFRYNFSLSEPMTWLCIAGFLLVTIFVAAYWFFPQIRSKC